MKIVAINGSHRGKNGNTDIMVEAFLKGARDAGAETVNILLAEKDIKYCLACKVCWFKTPGKCVLKDDMAEMISLIEGADIRVLATPLYFDNISSKLKAFMDRTMVTASPYWEQDEKGECRHLQNSVPPKLVMIANCGYPERSQFQVISHWIQRHARNINTEILCEIYASQGALLSIRDGELGAIVLEYLNHIEKAGREIVTNLELTDETVKSLEKKFIPDEIYIRECKKYVDELFNK